MKLSTRAVAAATAVVGIGLLVGGALLFVYSGIYDIAAREPHIEPVRWTLTTLQERSVEVHADGDTGRVPPLDDPDVVRSGFDQYRRLCEPCHGGPGVARERIGVGLNPNPPPLVRSAMKWDENELYWVTKNGLKMAGMPAFGLGTTDEELWAIVAFMRRLPRIEPAEYLRMVAVEQGALGPEHVDWVPPDESGWRRLDSQGDPERGAALIDRYGCGSCHLVPGLRADGMVGPPLTRFAERHYIAGTLLNTPDNLVAWIVNPQAIEPGTAMPAVGVDPDDALDIAAYLYTLGSRARLVERAEATANP